VKSDHGIRDVRRCAWGVLVSLACAVLSPSMATADECTRTEFDRSESNGEFLYLKNGDIYEVPTPAAGEVQRWIASQSIRVCDFKMSDDEVIEITNLDRGYIVYGSKIVALLKNLKKLD
jgi:hypothetical protein